MKELQEDFDKLLYKMRVFEIQVHKEAKDKSFSKKPDYYQIIQSCNSLALAKTYFDMYIQYKDLEY